MRFPKAYEEAKFIPSYDPSTGQHPLTIKTSTRKYAFGLMEQELQNATKAGERVLRWNLLDITEYCPSERHRPDLPKELRYIHNRLPLQNLSEKEYNDKTEDERKGFAPINAHAGCAKCPLLPVCKMRLSERPKEDVGGLYKPISYTISQFKGKSISPDMAEAQIMCWKPSQMGLVYGRFEDNNETGNTMTTTQAYEKFTGNKAPREVGLKELVQLMKASGVKFYAGVDWGFRHAYAITVSAIVAGEWWFVDTYSVPGLEYEEMVKLAESVRDEYRPVKWYADTSQPMFIKGFNRRKMPCQKFDKDVQGGIECVRGQIIDAYGRRRLKVLKHTRNQWLIEAFKMHHYKLDSAGNPTNEPDDEKYADVMDSVRYKGQNLFGSKSKGIVSPAPSPMEKQLAQAKPTTNEQIVYQDWMTQKIRNLATDAGVTIKSPTGGFIADFGSGDPEDQS